MSLKLVGKEIGKGVRSYAYKNYIIFFRYVDDVFQVVKITEGHRDIENLFDNFDNK